MYVAKFIHENFGQRHSKEFRRPFIKVPFKRVHMHTSSSQGHSIKMWQGLLLWLPVKNIHYSYNLLLWCLQPSRSSSILLCCLHKFWIVLLPRELNRKRRTIFSNCFCSVFSIGSSGLTSSNSITVGSDIELGWSIFLWLISSLWLCGVFCPSRTNSSAIIPCFKFLPYFLDGESERTRTFEYLVKEALGESSQAISFVISWCVTESEFTRFISFTSRTIATFRLLKDFTYFSFWSTRTLHILRSWTSAHRFFLST